MRGVNSYPAYLHETGAKYISDKSEVMHLVEVTPVLRSDQVEMRGMNVNTNLCISDWSQFWNKVGTKTLQKDNGKQVESILNINSLDACNLRFCTGLV